MKMPYKPLDDLTYLGQFVSSPMPVILRSDSQWKSFEDMMAFAKSNPENLDGQLLVKKVDLTWQC